MNNIEKIKSYFPILFDGAMGTYYRQKSENALPECEMANIFDEKTIYKIHKEYLEAGADAIKTNTFGANTRGLNCSKDIRDKIIISGYNIAKKAIEGYDKNEKEKLIFADIGPIPYAPQEGDILDSIVDEYKEIVDIFLKIGAKNFLFETLDEIDSLLEIFSYIRNKREDAFIIASFAINPDGYSRKGFYCEDLFNRAFESNQVNALGLNCISGPGYVLNTIKKINLPDIAISAMPNASYPTVVSNRVYYSDNPNYFANKSLDLMGYGVSIFGGCCGTSPSHIEKLKKKLQEVEQNFHKTNVEQAYKIKNYKKISTKIQESEFYSKLLSGLKPIAVELDPPVDVDIEKYMQNVEILKNVGVDAITIADCPIGRARVDSSLMAYKIKNEFDVEPIVHLTCRDRNLNATKALLLGLNIENIRNIIVVTGDPIPNAEKDEIKPVFNFNSKILAKYISDLNSKIFTNKMIISSGLNINAKNFDIELEKSIKKEEAGVKVFYTQPILSSLAIENIKQAKRKLKGRIMAGILPIVSYKNALFMNEEISGIYVGDRILGVYKGKDKETSSDLAVEVSKDMIKRVYDYVDGIYLITPFSRVDIIKRIIEEIKNNSI